MRKTSKTSKQLYAACLSFSTKCGEPAIQSDLYFSRADPKYLITTIGAATINTKHDSRILETDSESPNRHYSIILLPFRPHSLQHGPEQAQSLRR